MFLLIEITGLESYVASIGYVGILLWFLTVDQLTPIPEEITLITIGYLSSKGLIDPILAGLTSFGSLLLVDLVYYLLSRTGSRLIKRFFSDPKSKFIDSYKEKLTKHLGKTVFTLCFIPRMRFWNPILVGLMNLPFKRFIIFDIAGIFIFTVIYISLGIIFHNSLHKLMSNVELMQTIVFALGIAVLLLVFILIYKKVKQND